MSFGATLQAREETLWVSEYDGIESFNKATLTGSDLVSTDNLSESTYISSADNLLDMRTRSSLLTPKTSKLHEEFWHFYRGADSLSEMPCVLTAIWQEEIIKSLDRETFRRDRVTECDFWKLPLVPLSDDEEEEVATVKSSVKTALSRSCAKPSFNSRVCWKFAQHKSAKNARCEASLGSKQTAQGAEQMFMILAEQIY